MADIYSSSLTDSINERLAKVWKIIGSAYSFLFPDLSEDNSDNVILTLVKTRIATEGICRYILLYEKRHTAESMKSFTLDKYIESLSQGLLLSSRIRSKFSEIQSECNNSVHYKTDVPTKNDAVQCSFAFNEILDWFLENYGNTFLDENSSQRIRPSFTGRLPEREPSSYFIPRDTDAKTIHDKLRKEGYAYIHSRPGNGKTELCKYYAEKYKKDYDSIYYSENVTSIENWILDLPIKLPGIASMSHEEILNGKRDALWELYSPSSENKKTLIIIDNYIREADANPSILATILPKKYMGVHFIITTTESISEESLPLPSKPDISECRNLFRFNNHRPYSDEDVDHLIDLLFFNLRTIKMAASFLKANHQKIGIENIISQLEDNLKTSRFEDIYDTICISMIDDFKMPEDKLKTVRCLTLLPYSCVRMQDIPEMISSATEGTISLKRAGYILEELKAENWISVHTQNPEQDDDDTVIIPPIISDTVFTRIETGWGEPYIRNFIKKLVSADKGFNKMTESELKTYRPYMEHLTRRLLQRRIAGYSEISRIRDYFISTYDTKTALAISHIISDIATEHDLTWGSTDVQQAGFMEGIAELNVEEFEKASELFSGNINLNRKRLNNIKDRLATALAYEAHALAETGEHDIAIEHAKESISLRLELVKSGDKSSIQREWIAWYNYALSLFHAKRYDEAYEACTKALKLFAQDDRDGMAYHRSSPLHLLGQIKLKLSPDDQEKILDAIKDIEEARSLRADLKGNNFWVAQIDVFLGEAYEMLADLTGDVTSYSISLNHLNNAYSIKQTQFRTDSMIKQIKLIETAIERINTKKEAHENKD